MDPGIYTHLLNRDWLWQTPSLTVTFPSWLETQRDSPLLQGSWDFRCGCGRGGGEAEKEDLWVWSLSETATEAWLSYPCAVER